MAYFDQLNCCGIKELTDIQGQKPETILKKVTQDWFDDTPRAFIIFSVVNQSVSGKNLCNYIKEQGLGKVFKMPKKLNQNTHNQLHMWCWAVNNPGLKSLALKKGWYERERDMDW